MFDATSPCEPLRDRDLQRVDGAARVAVKSEGGRTMLAELYQRSPCKVLFPHVDGEKWREAVFLNTAGGVAGGDVLRYEALATGEASLVVTTQAAERVYRAIDTAGRVETRIEARDTATLEWLPQETILFDGGRLSRSTEIHCASGASVLAMDWLILGRAASGERVAAGEVRDHWRLYRDGRLVWADAFRLGGDIAALQVKKPLLSGCNAIATLLYTALDAAVQLEHARELLSKVAASQPSPLAGEGGAERRRVRGTAAGAVPMDSDGEPPIYAGATVVNGVLVCRLAAADASDLRAAVIEFLRAFRGRLRGKPVSLPKVWTC